MNLQSDRVDKSQHYKLDNYFEFLFGTVVTLHLPNDSQLNIFPDSMKPHT